MKEYKYLTYGIIAGVLIGTIVAVIAHLNIGICVGLAMLLGIVIGTTIDYGKKKKSDKRLNFSLFVKLVKSEFERRI